MEKGKGKMGKKRLQIANFEFSGRGGGAHWLGSFEQQR